jgi:ATP phosphoribosyltransferase
MLKNGKNVIGVTGEDLFKEYKLKNVISQVNIIEKIPWVDQTAIFNKPTLCLLGPIGKKLKNLDTICTKPKVALNPRYKFLSEKYLKELKSKNFDFEKIYLNGCLEEAYKMGLCDLVIDIVYSGKSAREAGLGIIERIMESDIVLLGVKE